MYEDFRGPSEYEMDDWREELETLMTFKQWQDTGIIFEYV